MAPLFVMAYTSRRLDFPKIIDVLKQIKPMNAMGRTSGWTAALTVAGLGREARVETALNWTFEAAPAAGSIVGWISGGSSGRNGMH